MSLESLVPPLEMCQQLKPGDFPESALVYEVYHYQYKLDPHVMDRETSKTTRPESCESVHAAITSDEIMAKLPLGTILQQDEPGVWVCIVHGGEPGIMIEKANNPATAALRLWMHLNGREVKG